MQNWHDRVVSVGHSSIADALQSRLEGGLLDLGSLLGVSKGVLDLSHSGLANAIDKFAQVSMLITFNGREHELSASVHVSLQFSALLGHVVDKSSLLDEVVLTVDVNVFNLLLGLTQVHGLFLLDQIDPLGSQLLHLVGGVLVVENSEFGTGQPGEVANLNVAKVESNEEFVVENHAANPLVVRPATEARNRGDSGDISEHHDKSTTGA